MTAEPVEALALVVDNQISIDDITNDETCMENLRAEAWFQGHRNLRVARVEIREVAE